MKYPKGFWAVEKKTHLLNTNSRKRKGLKNTISLPAANSKYVVQRCLAETKLQARSRQQYFLKKKWYEQTYDKTNASLSNVLSPKRWPIVHSELTAIKLNITFTSKERPLLQDV